MTLPSPLPSGWTSPGPWTLAKRDKFFFIDSSAVGFAEPGNVATVWNKLPSSEANARLIAAAPDLLEALTELLAHASFVGIAPHYEDLARAAIAKAEGRIPDIQIKGAA